jgi:putative methanogenesis marker 16 metalloprotein
MEKPPHNKNQRNIAEIKQKLHDGTAAVMTAQEVCDALEKGENIRFEDVDVVTTATKGIMSGTSLILGFRIAEPKLFTKLRTISMNGIDCYPGPAPNETLGVVDLTVYGTQKSHDDPNYGGGHLFRDLVEQKEIKIHAESVEGIVIDTTVTLNDMAFAQMLGTRHAFRNYNAFLNPGKNVVNSIFSVMGMQPNNKETSFCGVGTLNPLENDPELQTIGVGSPILINGAKGYILSYGTRSSPSRANLMTTASLFDMIPEYMGGFQTSNGPEVICSIAIPIPILNQSILKSVTQLDAEIDLNFVDILGRAVISKTNYGEAWDSDFVIGFLNRYCDDCELNKDCPIVHHCPTACFTVGKGMDKKKCFNCGTCLFLCPYHAFTGNLGALTYNNQKIPITLRQSDRFGAIKLMEQLKTQIIDQSFPIIAPVDKLPALR